MINSKQIHSFVSNIWDESIIPELSEYIRIPCKSHVYDPGWQTNGNLVKAAKLMVNWAKEHEVPGMQIDLLESDDKAPLLFVEIPGSNDKTALLYGHLDKMPESDGWNEGLGPWTPVLIDNKLYGRGGADDGYAFFSSLAAILALREQGLPHSRCVILIEGGEECGSEDLPFYIEQLKDRIGSPTLIVCLDSGCGNYDQLWCTSSLRGSVGGVLRVETLTESMHSGDASGIVPGTFRILRILLSRIEDMYTGEILLSAANVEIPTIRKEQTATMAKVLGDKLISTFPFVEGCGPVNDDHQELLLNRTWRPTLVVTGADYFPNISNAGNVLRAKSHVKLSVRIPPNCDARKVLNEIKTTLEKNPPYGAKVVFQPGDCVAGWDAPENSEWLAKALHDASYTYFGKEPIFMGEGGSIGFIPMLQEKFPEAQFLITGILGPQANAHGPNECLRIDAVKKLTSCVAHVLYEHCQNT